MERAAIVNQLSDSPSSSMGTLKRRWVMRDVAFAAAASSPRSAIHTVLELHRRQVPGPERNEQHAPFGDQCVRWLPKLRRYARSLASDRFAADDLVQDTMLLALRKRERFAPGTDLRAWLFTIMRNQLINGVRRATRQGLQVDLSEAPDAVSGDQEINQAIQELRRALAQMPERKRQIVVLAYCHEHTYDEIADMLKIPAGTFRSRLARARVLLRGIMESKRPQRPNQRAQLASVTGERSGSK
jgi:RNA polymerase sigma-70 factor (ECF subfamily)